MSIAKQVPGTNDLDLSTGNITLVPTLGEEVAQRVRNRLALVQGEWFLDARIGIPYFGLLLVKNPDIPAIKQVLRRAIAGVQGVASVDTLDITVDGRSRASTITFRCTASDGTVFEGGAGSPFIFEGATQG